MAVGLSDRELRQIATVFKKYPRIRQVVLFGSRAMNTHKIASDVDLALKGPVSFDIISKVKGELEENTSLPYTFDVVDYGTIENPAFKEHVDRYGQLIYSSVPS